jgi:rhodanese-related sulfurtransferase
MKITRKLISTSFLFFILFYCKAQTSTGLNVAEFERGISNQDSVQLLDVRTPGEYNSGHIKNALLADWKDENEFTRRIGFMDKQMPVYVYCLAGGRSAAAAAKMRAMGYQKVYELEGGINAWKAGNKAMEGGTSEKQMSTGELNEAINASRLVLVDFGAEWCPPCKKMEPVLKSLQNNNPKRFTLVKVDGGRDEDILKKYNVTTLPVFILFKDGKQVWRKDGIVKEKEIARLFD